MERRLSAILSTDVVGYSRLMAADAEGTLRTLTAYREQLSVLVRQHRGRVVNAPGDNLLAEFPSALDATCCAIEIQRVVGARNQPLPTERRMEFRIGIHLGDVMVDGQEIYGDGVNIAARLEGLAEPGGVCVSRAVHDQVRNKLEFAQVDLGEQVVKNIPEPVHAYAVDVPGTSTALRARRTGPRTRVRRARRLAVVGAAVLALVALMVLQHQQQLSFWWAFHAPTFLLSRVDQEIAFTETSDGIRIAYAKSGRGPPLVLVVGWFTHLERGPIYDSPDLVAGLSTERKLVRYDGRGFGLSDREVTDFSLDARVRDLAAVVDALGVEKVALYGASLGGATAIAYAARHPDRVSHLVLAGATLGAGVMGLTAVETVEDLKALVALVRSSWDRNNVRSLVAAVVTRGAGPDEIQTPQLADFLAISGDGAAYAGFAATVPVLDVSQEARRVGAPTLLIVGDNDLVYPIEHSRRLATLIRHARVEILPNTSHLGTMRSPRAMRLVLDFLAETPAARGPEAPAWSSEAGFWSRPAIAVLPFDNLSDDPEQDYFVAGLVEDLIMRLSSWRGLPVIARNSSFVYQGQAVDVRQVSRELGARYVVEGSVRRSEDRVRISAQLIDGITGHHVWAQQYDRAIEEVFALQDAISAAIVGSMQPELLQFESARAVRRDPASLDAWELAQRGWWHYNRYTKADNARARSFYERAIELDPQLAWAFAGLAMTHYHDAVYRWTDSPAQSVAELIRAAERSVELEHDDPFAQLAMSQAYQLRGQREQELAAIDFALERDPSLALGYYLRAPALCITGRPDEAIESLEQAIRLSPRDPWLGAFYAVMGMAHFGAQRYEEAVDWGRQSLQRTPPDWPIAYSVLAASYGQLGRTGEARSALEARLRQTPDYTLASVRELLAGGDPDFVERYVEGLRRAGLEQ